MTENEVTINELSAADDINGEELILVHQGTIDVKATSNQLAEYTKSKVQEDIFTDSYDPTDGDNATTGKGVAAALSSLNPSTYITGTCDTAAATEAKEVTIENFNLINGATIGITFTNGNTYGDCTLTTPTYPTLSINEGTAYPICDSRGHTAGKGFCNAGDYIELRFTGDRFVIINSDVRQSIKGTTGYNIYSNNYVKQWWPITYIGKINNTWGSLYETSAISITYSGDIVKTLNKFDVTVSSGDVGCSIEYYSTDRVYLIRGSAYTVNVSITLQILKEGYL